MAKRKASRGEFNMSQAIRDQLTANPKLSLRECREAVEAANPSVKINVNSFGVAFSNQRAKLGIKSKRGRKRVRVMKPAAAAAAASKPVKMEHLQAARKFVAEIGNADVAVAAVKALAQLQIG